MYGISTGPQWWDQLHTDAVDVRGLNFTIDLGPPNLSPADPIVSVTSIVITRQDGGAITPADLAVLTAPTIDSSGLLVSTWFGAGTSGGVYIVRTTVLTTAGRTLPHDRLVLVAI